MLAMNSYARRYRVPSNPATFINTGPSTILSRPRLPLRTYMKPKSPYNIANIDPTPFCRSKRFKSRKINGCQKIETVKKKTPDYTETVYREAVSKLKYLLAESYAPRLLSGKLPRDRLIYRRSNLRINEATEDSDDRSVSDCSRAKGFSGNQFEEGTVCEASDKNRRLVGTPQNSVSYPARDIQSSPSELTSFIARQEEYIEQLEQESRYCKGELKNLLEKIREVVAENEALHDKNKSNLLKSFLRDYENCEEAKKPETTSQTTTEVCSSPIKQTKVNHRLEGPSIVFESRISELEAQLTQARIELKKAREENEACNKRLAENSANQASPDLISQFDSVVKEKHELSVKLEEALKNLQAARDRENETTLRAKRATELVHQSDYDKYQADSEIRRLNDELDRQREKLREAAQETSRRVAEERQQIERRFSQQVEQLSADVASHWDSASKSQMETEKQRRELAELKRDLGQKQSMIDELKKELQNKISKLQSDLNQAIAEKDAAEQEIATAKLSVERVERQSRQEQSRCQAEINSYKQRLERADADIVHCRRENLRLSEQIASLEKELNMNKLISQPESKTPAATPRPEGEKDLTTMIMDIETKHEKPVEGDDDDGGGINSTTAPSKKKRTVKVDLKVKVTPKKKSISSKTVEVPLSAQEEMANLQNKIENLTSKVNDTFESQKETPVPDRENARHDESNATLQKSGTEYDYNERPEDNYDNQNRIYSGSEEIEKNDTRTAQNENYAIDPQKYEGQEYPENQNYSTDYTDQGYEYGQYDASLYQQDPSEQDPQVLADANSYQQNQQYDDSYQQDQNYAPENYENVNPQVPIDDQQNYENATIPESSISKT